MVQIERDKYDRAVIRDTFPCPECGAEMSVVISQYLNPVIADGSLEVEVLCPQCGFGGTAVQWTPIEDLTDDNARFRIIDFAVELITLQKIMGGTR